MRSKLSSLYYLAIQICFAAGMISLVLTLVREQYWMTFWSFCILCFLLFLWRLPFFIRWLKWYFGKKWAEKKLQEAEEKYAEAVAESKVAKKKFEASRKWRRQINRLIARGRSLGVEAQVRQDLHKGIPLRTISGCLDSTQRYRPLLDQAAQLGISQEVFEALKQNQPGLAEELITEAQQKVKLLAKAIDLGVEEDVKAALSKANGDQLAHNMIKATEEQQQRIIELEALRERVDLAPPGKTDKQRLWELLTTARQADKPRDYRKAVYQLEEALQTAEN